MTTPSIPARDTIDIVRAVVTGSGRSEDIRQQLDSLGIEWHITESGDLWIRSWQVVGEDFVPRDQVAEIQGSHTPPTQSSDLEWVSRNLPELEATYAGQWIAVDRGKVVAAATDLPSLLQQIAELGVEGPFITQIPSEPVIWTTAYHAG